VPAESGSFSPGRRVAVLLSGAGTLLQALLDGAAQPGCAFDVVAAIADRQGAAGLDRARQAGVPASIVAASGYQDRTAWNRALAERVGGFEPDLIVLAGFMRLVGEPLLTAYHGRILNTHPALLPAFAGAHGVRDALAYGVKVTGCSIIMVDAGIDTGPIVAQRAVEVRQDDDEETLHERIKVVERALLVEVVGRMTKAGWSVDGRTVRIG